MNNIKIKLVLFAVLLGLIPHLSLAQTGPNAIVEDAVRFYFADAPVMIDIARCETTFRQYNPDGSPLYDASHTYIGVFQIADTIHRARAQSLGFDISGIDGNLQYARYLYNSSGTNPWKGCLPAGQAGVPKQDAPVTSTSTPVTPVATPTVSVSGNFTSNLRMGMTSNEVKLLQQVLNNKGFIIATAGVGSPGNETNYFGALTRDALRKFQCAKSIVCTGDEATTGYGRVGPATRSALNSL